MREALVLLLVLLAIRGEKSARSFRNCLFRPARQRSACFLDYEQEHEHDSPN